MEQIKETTIQILQSLVILLFQLIILSLGVQVFVVMAGIPLTVFDGPFEVSSDRQFLFTCWLWLALLFGFTDYITSLLRDLKEARQPNSL